MGWKRRAISVTPSRPGAARRGLRQSRRETAAASQERDDLIDQRDTARAYTASKLGGGAPPGGRDLAPDKGLLGRLRAFGRPSAPRPSAAADPEPLTRLPAADAPVRADDSGEVSQP